ncbi:MAG: RadC family protein, partial [Opitutales bacterium]
MSEVRYHIRFQDLAVNERPQERLERLGAGALSEAELLAMFLRRGTSKTDVIGLAHEVLRLAGSLSGLARLSAKDYSTIHGIGPVRALQLEAMVEIVRRMWSAPDAPAPLLDAPEKVTQLLRPRALGLAVEKFWVLCLNTKNRLVRLEEVTSGTATASLVHPREVFRSAVRHGATALICAHNHPSGDPAPSQADIRVTRQLRNAAEALDIELLDH